MIFHGTGMFILAFFDEYPLLILFALFHGLAWGIRGPQMVAIRADYFGPESFGRIMGDFIPHRDVWNDWRTNYLWHGRRSLWNLPKCIFQHRDHQYNRSTFLLYGTKT